MPTANFKHLSPMGQSQQQQAQIELDAAIIGSRAARQAVQAMTLPQAPTAMGAMGTPPTGPPGLGAGMMGLPPSVPPFSAPAARAPLPSSMGPAATPSLPDPATDPSIPPPFPPLGGGGGAGALGGPPSPGVPASPLPQSYATGGQVGASPGLPPSLTGATLSAEEMTEIVTRLAQGEQIDPNQYVRMPNIGGAAGISGSGTGEQPGMMPNVVNSSPRGGEMNLPQPPAAFLEWLEAGTPSTPLGEEIRDMVRNGEASAAEAWAIAKAYAAAPDPDEEEPLPDDLLLIMGKKGAGKMPPPDQEMKLPTSEAY